MGSLGERRRDSSFSPVTSLAAEHDTSVRAIRTLLDRGIPEGSIGDVLEIRGFLSRDSVSITARGNRANDIVNLSAVVDAYNAVGGDIDDLRLLAELTLRHVTSRTIFMRGAFTRALRFVINNVEKT